MAHESILALEFGGLAGLTGKMQSEGHGLCCLQCTVPPAIFDTSFVSNQVEYNTAAFSMHNRSCSELVLNRYVCVGKHRHTE